jgi:hypothetical protein
VQNRAVAYVRLNGAVLSLTRAVLDQTRRWICFRVRAVLLQLHMAVATARRAPTCARRPFQEGARDRRALLLRPDRLQRSCKRSAGRRARNWRGAGGCGLGPTRLLRRRRDTQLGASGHDQFRSKRRDFRTVGGQRRLVPFSYDAKSVALRRLGGRSVALVRFLHGMKRAVEEDERVFSGRDA